MVVGEAKRTNIMDGIENTGDVRMHDHRLRLKQRFDIVRKLGQGTYGKVQLGINKKTGQEVAIKTIKKCKIETDADLVRIRREVQIMSSVRHPNIVHIYEVFENSEKMILVMEYCSGGELYDYLSQKKVLQEEEARRIFRQIATAVYYCHIHKICHRDLKLENVLLDDTGSAKIADFGLSNVFKETSLLSTFCGSPLYASPEIVKGTPYIGPEVDCWSLGVLLYTLVYGAMPFDGSNFKRLVRQISNGDYYEPKSPSTASPLIRDMLTVDPLKRADIVYICDHPWVNVGCETGCLEMSESLAAETPVRLDLLLSLAPPAQNTQQVVVPSQNELGTEDSCTDLTNSITAMPVEPSNSAEKRILDLVAEGGEDAIKPSPTRTIVSATDNKRKLELAMSASGLQRKKEKVAGSPSESQDLSPPPLPSSSPPLLTPTNHTQELDFQPTLVSSATMTITPSPMSETKAEPKENDEPKEPKDEVKEKPSGTKPKVVKKKISPAKSVEETEGQDKDEAKNDAKCTTVSSAAEKLTNLSIQPPAANQAPKPKKLSIPGGNVGSFKEQFERRASLTNTTPEVKRPVTKPVVSKIAKPKAQSEDRELPNKEIGSVRLQQIGIEPSLGSAETHHAGGVKKTESEPTHSTTTLDPTLLLQDARRSLQNSMAKLVEGQSAGEDRRRARDIISSAIRGGKPPVPYGRSSSAGLAPVLTPVTAVPTKPVFRTEAHHRVDDHRNRGVSVERIIPIRIAEVDPPTAAAPPSTPAPATPQISTPPSTASSSRTQMPVRRLQSNESVTSETSSSGEPIKKSAREFIIPIAVEGKGFVTPRQGSVDSDIPTTVNRHSRLAKPRRISLVSGGESEEDDDAHSMHRLRSSRAARAESVSSGEEDEEDEGFHLLTAENLFSTLLHRVRALTNRLNGEEGPGFSQNPHSLFNNLQSPFFKSPRLSRRHNALREGWSSNFNKDFDSMFNKSRQPFPRGINKKSGKHQGKSTVESEGSRENGLDLSDLDLKSISLGAAELEALSGLTPALSRRLQRQLLAQLPPAAARELRRTLSANGPTHTAHLPRRSHSSTGTNVDNSTQAGLAPDQTPEPPATKVSPPPNEPINPIETPAPKDENFDVTIPQFSTLPRLKRRSVSREVTPSLITAADISYEPKITINKDLNNSRGSSIRSTPDRSLLSKYLTPERTLSLDDSYSSDSGGISTSLLSEPSYIAAYGTPTLTGGTTGLGLRRHSMRLTGDQPRKRISRFLRPDFFDTPPEESVYAKHKKEKEMETQKILKEIREKKNKTQEVPKTPIDTTDFTTYEPRKCLSPLSLLTSKDRSRSTTPFYPMLDNIKETTLDSSIKSKADGTSSRSIDYKSNYNDSDNNTLTRESRLLRPKSYPIKNIDSIEQMPKVVPQEIVDTGNKDKSSQKESKLLRPRSYPTSSPSPEKVVVNRNSKKDDTNEKQLSEINNDVEVSITLTLPKKTQPSLSNSKHEIESLSNNPNKVTSNDTLLVKKYKVVDTKEDNKALQSVNHKSENGNGVVQNGQVTDSNTKEDTNYKVTNHDSKDEHVTLKPVDTEATEKKGTIKKKVVKKVSTKTKGDSDTSKETSDGKPVSKKKIVKKVKEKSTDEPTKPVVKKKSMLQSIGHKLEKFASNKSSSPDKEKVENKPTSNEQVAQVERNRREHSVPVNVDPPNEPQLIKRAETITDVAALDPPNNAQAKTTVSKVLGLFKKFDSKEKSNRASVEKTVDVAVNSESNGIITPGSETNEKSKRPTSLLLNGLGRKTKYNRAASDSVSIASSQEEEQTDKKQTGRRNSLRLDFSRLPRVKKVAPSNPAIEPQIVFTQDADNNQNDKADKNGLNPDSLDSLITRIQERSRSRSRSNFSNSESRDNDAASPKSNVLEPLSFESQHQPHREHEPTSPEKEDLAERIRRKSFYSRFNEKKQRRKSSLVGPGAVEYDPVARIHSQTAAAEVKMETSPTSPGTYDLSPGFSTSTDLSPSTERYRSLMTELPTSPRSSLRFDNNYGVNNYRSLDRSALRKYPGMRSYLEYDPNSYGAHRYARTVSLVEDPQDPEMSSLRDAHKYNRTVSMYSPGNYATFRPKTTRNPAIILKDNEKEPSPENILEKIKQRKNFSISVTRKADNDKDVTSRPDITSKSEGHSSECSEKVDGEGLLK